MNWEIFTRIVKAIYKHDDFEPQGSERYTVDEYLNIFGYFFDFYKAMTGEDHPPLKRGHIKDIMERLPYAIYDGEIGGVDICAAAYPELIEDYFGTQFRNCDYRIFHFMSDNVRILRMYETGWL